MISDELRANLGGVGAAIHGDPVKHPSHYTDGPTHHECGKPIECIDITRDMNFCLGNVVKYLWRSGKKDQEKRVEDLEKARQYITFEIERLTDET